MEITISIIIASICLNMGITVIRRINKIKEKKEVIFFFIIAITAAAWAIQPYINRFYSDYRWLSALIITNAAIAYAMHITKISYKTIFYIITIICDLIILYFLITGHGNKNYFPMIFSVCIFPILIFFNFILYYHYLKYKSGLHLSLAIMASFMILGGFYDTFKYIYDLPKIPASTLGCFFFILICGYNLIDRGYLLLHGWKDYANAIAREEQIKIDQNKQLKQISIDSVLMLSQTIEAKDKYTRGHCIRVRDYSLAIGKHLNFNKERMMKLEFSAILHDIGKIGVPGRILNKPGKLDKTEFEYIKQHPSIGASILANVVFYKPIIPIVEHHHEFFNGKGYPDGLSGSNIPIEARILSVADVYDALTTNRPYRKALAKEKALSILKEMSGNQLDAKLLDIFLTNRIYGIEHDMENKILFNF